MPHPPSSDPDRLPRADADEIAADLERLRRASERRPLRLRLRREVRRAELALLAVGVVAAGFLALHLAERGNEVSLTARAASSSTSPPEPGHAKPGAAANPPSEVTRASPAPAPPTTASVTASPPSAPKRDAPSAVGPDTATTVPAPEVETTSTTSTSTTTSTTTSTSTTTTALPTP